MNYSENLSYQIKSLILERKVLNYSLDNLLIIVGYLLAVLSTFEGNLAIAAVPQNTSSSIPSVSSIIKSDVTISNFDDMDVNNNPMSQINSISELKDVQSNDWTAQILQSLIKRYACNAENLNENRITRSEFAAKLNICLIHINKIIATRTPNFVTEEDLVNIKKLQGEFTKELASISTRIYTLNVNVDEARTHQFSTTTKLSGEAIFAVTGVFGGAGGSNNNVFQNRVRLNFQTSFTGKDLLNTRLDAGNASTFRLPDYAAKGVQTFNLTYPGDKVNIGWLAYYFPIGNKIDAYVAAVSGVLFDFAPTLNPFLDSSTGGSRALTEFASSSPIYRIGGGAGVGINYKFSNQFLLSLGYLSGSNANPGLGSGLFQGQYSAIAQLTWNPNRKSGIGLTYVNAYQKNFGAIFDLGSSVAFVGTTQANYPFSKTISNSYGIEAFYKFSPQFAVNGYFGYTNAKDLAGSGSADIWYYALGMAFPDLGKKGNLGGIIVGAEPYRSDNLPPANNLSLHLEGFYKYQLTDNISITPGIIWITAPGQNANNGDAIIGTVRTTFNF